MVKKSKKSEVNSDLLQQLDIRVGTVVEAKVFAEARKPAYRMLIDFGELGILKSSAQITDFYKPNDLKGKQVVAVVNFPPKQIANLKSECLVLGIETPDGVVLLQPSHPVNNGFNIA